MSLLALATVAALAIGAVSCSGTGGGGDASPGAAAAEQSIATVGSGGTTPSTLGQVNSAESAGPTDPATVPTLPPSFVATDPPTTLAQVELTTVAPEPTTEAPTTVEVPPASELPATTVDPFAGYTRVAPLAVPIVAVGEADGEPTKALQQRLLELGFWLSGVDGAYGTTTRQAVMAFQKYSLMPATGEVDQATAEAISAMPIRAVATAREGDLTEIDKSRQLLFFVRRGVTLWVLNASTGNGLPYEEEDQNSPGEIARGVSLTPDGEHKVDREREQGWWEGDLGKIYRPKYFINGVAVHGSGSVPNYPASHGCVRVSVAAMDYIWAQDLMPMRSLVWVH